MARKRKSSETKKESPQGYRTRSKGFGTEETVDSLPVKRKHEQLTNISEQKCKEGNYRETDQAELMTGVTAHDSPIIEQDKKLKIVVRKNSKTGEWTALEDIKHEETEGHQRNPWSATIKFKSLKNGSRESTKTVVEGNALDGSGNGQPKKCSSAKLQTKRKSGVRKRKLTKNTTSLKSKKWKKSECKNPNLNDDLQKLENEADAVTKQPCMEMEKNLKLPEKTIDSDCNIIEDNIKQEITSLSDDIEVPVEQANTSFKEIDNDKEGKVTLSNEMKAWTEHNEYANEDVYVVELCDDGDDTVHTDIECEFGNTDAAGIQEMIDIKLLPYETTITTHNSTETKDIILGKTDPGLHEKSIAIDTKDTLLHTTGNDVNQDCTGRNLNRSLRRNGTAEFVAEKTEHLDIDNTIMNEAIVESNVGTTGAATEGKSEMNETSMQKKTYKNEKTLEKNIAVNETALEKKTGVNETALEKNTDVPAIERNTGLNETAVENNTNLYESAVANKTDMNEVAAERNVDLYDTTKTKNTNVSETTIEKTTDMNEAALRKNTSMNERGISINETKLDQLFSENNTDSFPENIRNVEELISWTVGQTSCHVDNMRGNGSVTNETYNQQGDVTDLNQFYKNSADNYDENNNCLIEVYMIDDNKADEHKDTDEIIIYDNVSHINDSLYADNACYSKDEYMFNPDVNSNQVENQDFRYESHLDDEVNNMFVTDYAEQDSLEEGDWLPVNDMACLSPVTDFRYENIPYWDPCLGGIVGRKEQVCDKGLRNAPVIAGKRKRNGKTKEKTDPDMKHGVHSIPYPCLTEDCQSEYNEYGISTTLNTESDMMDTMNTDNFGDNGEVKCIPSRDSITAIIARSARRGCSQSKAKRVSSKKKSPFKGKKASSAVKKCNSSGGKKTGRGGKRNCQTKDNADPDMMNVTEYSECNIQFDEQVKCIPTGESITAVNASSARKVCSKSKAKRVSRKKKLSFKEKASSAVKKCNSGSGKQRGRCRKEKYDLCTRIVDDVVERKKMLRKMKNAQYGRRPHVVRVTKEGIIIDVSEEYKQHLPYEYVSR